jgi:hypothetical protein
MRFDVVALSDLAAALEQLPEPGASENEQPATRRVTRAQLPPVTTLRWTARRKATVVAAVSEGLLTHDEVYSRYQVSAEEFTLWQQVADLRAAGPRATGEVKPR